MTIAFKYQRAVPIALGGARFSDAFWAPKLDLVRRVTVADVLNKLEHDRGGAFNNFDRVASGAQGGHAGPPWYDALIYECIRGASDLIAQQADAQLQARLAGYIQRIAAAQDVGGDGYLNTWVTLLSPETRWGANGGDFIWQHELYTVGALVEAAEHYWRAVGDPSLLQVAIRAVESAARVAGPPPSQNLIPEHALPEEALISLHRLLTEHPTAVKDSAASAAQCLELARFWIDQRGYHDGRRPLGEYAQDHVPIIEQTTVVGHAVRAALLYSGVATLAMATGEQTYLEAATRLWENCVSRRMYVTGGIGAYFDEERMGGDFDLPNEGYLETCAAVAMAFWHHAMFQATADGKYIDELERVAYNGVLVGLQNTGDRYYYVNPLNSRDNVRWAWHECPCCPPMLLKFFGSLPSFAYASNEEALFVNLYVAGTASIRVGQQLAALNVDTCYPWKGHIKITLTEPGEFALKLRIPGWTRGVAAPSDLYRFESTINSERRPTIWRVELNGQPLVRNDENVQFENGYFSISRKWTAGDQVTLDLPMPVERVIADERVLANKGHVAWQRGPLVYCIEGMDTELGIGVPGLALPRHPPPSVEHDANFLGGVTVIRGEGVAKLGEGRQGRPTRVTAIPYFAQNNRSAGTVRVWLEN